jgi:hypothetical protein
MLAAPDGLACKEECTLRTQASTGQPNNRHSLRNGVTAYRALSPENRLDCLRRPPIIFGRLDPSIGGSGPHAFAVRRPHHSSEDAAFVHRIPPPTFVTTAKRPSYRGGTGRVSASDLPDGASGKIAASGVTQPKPFEVPSKIGFRRGRLCPLSPSLRARDRRARGGSAGRGVDRRVNQPTSSETSGRIIIVRQLIAVRC